MKNSSKKAINDQIIDQWKPKSVSIKLHFCMSIKTDKLVTATWKSWLIDILNNNSFLWGISELINYIEVVKKMKL